jgi:hypothetical protein
MHLPGDLALGECIPAGPFWVATTIPAPGTGTGSRNFLSCQPIGFSCAPVTPDAALRHAAEGRASAALAPMP